MSIEGGNLVVGLFGSRSQADAALAGLHRIGLTDADVELGAPNPGRYRIEYQEAAELGRGAFVGTVVGIPVGAIIGWGFLMAIVPGMATLTALGLGLLIGGFWGIFFGGLAGVALKVIAQKEEEPRCAIAPGGPEVLVIARASDRIDAAQQEMQSHGARYFLKDVPAVRSA